MKRKQLLLMFFCLLFFSAKSFSQDILVSGSVTDRATGVGMPSVSIRIKETKQNTQADTDGHFKISAQKGQTLIFSFVGYKTIEERVKNTDPLKISLESIDNSLSEIVVVGYGTQKKASLTGAIGIVKSDAFSNRPITNATQALSGMVPGVWVNQTSGQPGADGANIRIRGIGTLNNSAALVVVDGVVGSLGSLNPNDIESISVLKDASAAIYGSRAANGVILVQTKSGAKGKVKVAFSTSFGKQKAIARPEMVTNSVELMELYNQARANNGQTPYYSDATIQEYKNGTDPSVYPNTDWMNFILRPANIQSNQLSVSGGQDKTQFNVSLGYTNQDGIVRNGNAKLYNLRTNITTKVSDKLEIGLRSGIRYQNQKESYNGAGTMFYELSRTLPYFGTYTNKGEYASTWVNAINTIFRSPLVMTDEGKNDKAYGNFNTNAFLNYEIIKGLKFNITGGLEYRINDNQVFTPKINVYNPKSGAIVSTMNAGGPNASNTWDKNMYTTLFSSLTYNKKIGEDHDFTVAAIYSQEENNFRSLGGSIIGFVNNSLQEINAGVENPLINGTSNRWAIRSYIGRMNYAFREKYLLEGIARYDGSSRFSSDNRWGFFPGVTAGWRITKEDFMKDQKIFNELKLRASWGRSGNDQIGLYAYIPTLAFARFYPFNDNVITGIAQMNLVDENIKWEVGTKRNIGLDATLLNNSLNITFDYFMDKREGILRSIQLPTFIGIRNPPVKNLATVTNKGWELSASYNKKFDQVSFQAGFNLTYVKNKIDYIPDPQKSMFALLQGESINSFYMWKAIGIFKTQAEVDASSKQTVVPTMPGDIKFEDLSGPNGIPDGIIDQNDRQVVGKPMPTWTYGANFSVAYKGIDLRINLQGVADVESYVGNELYYPFINGAGVLKSWSAGNTWTPENPDASMPRLLEYSASQNQNYATNSFWLQNASYLRVKDIQLGYSLPKHILEKIKLGGLRVYIDAQNAFTITKFKGLDPERDLNNTTPQQYPNVRIISAGIGVTF